jgi:MFS family permease
MQIDVNPDWRVEPRLGFRDIAGQRYLRLPITSGTENGCVVVTFATELLRSASLSLLLVGSATFLMGCLPTFAQIGYWAPALLVALRFIQGFAVGGEWGGAVLLVAEHSPNSSRGFWASWPQAGVPGGNMLATVALLGLTSTLSDVAFLSWGWRVAFWLSAVVVLIGYYVRTKVHRCTDLHRSSATSPTIQDELARCHRSVKALPTWHSHRHGPASW